MIVFIISAIITFFIFKKIILPFARNLAKEDKDTEDFDYYSGDTWD